MKRLSSCGCFLPGSVSFLEVKKCAARLNCISALLFSFPACGSSNDSVILNVPFVAGGTEVASLCSFFPIYSFLHYSLFYPPFHPKKTFCEIKESHVLLILFLHIMV